MKQLLSVTALLVALPGAAHAQIDVVFNGSRPVVRANVAGVNVSASLGSTGGLDLRVNDVPIGRNSMPSTRRTSTGTSSRTTTSTSRTTRSTRASASAAAVIATGDTYVGTKYVWGGETPAGFDCSGFVQYVFRQHGVELPRTSRQQAQVGLPVSKSLSALEVGDLLFFATSGRISHVAMYAGNNQILHSSSSNGGVAYDDLSSNRGQWFVDHHVATRRVLANGQNLVGPLTAALRAFTQFDPPDHAPKR